MNNNNKSQQIQLLIFFCQLAIQKEALEFPFPNGTKKANWHNLIALATYHSIRPLLYRGIMKWKNKDQVPKVIQEQLKLINIQIAANNLNQTKELIRIIKLFKSNDIEVIPFKGVLLANSAYDNLGAREFTDIDMLVRSGDHAAIRKVLLNENYDEVRRPPILEKLYKKYNCESNFRYFHNNLRLFHIEPHWYIGHKMYQLDFGFDEIAPFTEKKLLFGTILNSINCEGLLLTTCLHHCGKEQMKILKYAYDIAAILNQYGDVINWDSLLDYAKKWKVKNLLLLGLSVTNELFPCKLPIRVVNALNAKKIKYHTQKCLEVLHNEQSFEVSTKGFFQTLKFHFSIRAHWSTKIKVLYYHIVQLILPNIEDAKGNEKELSRYKFWTLLLKKPFRLWSKYIEKPLE